MTITKIIIPAAGLGTRFLPFTKIVPKELLPLLETPALHHIIQEGIQSNISKFGIIINKEKQALQDYWDKPTALLLNALNNSKKMKLKPFEKVRQKAAFTYIEQTTPKGLGHAIAQARDYIKEPFFCVVLPDDIVYAQIPALQQLLTVAHTHQATILAVQEVPKSSVSSYGIITPHKTDDPNIFEVSSVIEKPSPEQAPSNLAIIGRYVLTHKIFTALEELETIHTTGELQLTNAIGLLIKRKEPVFACKITGHRFDIGSPLGWLKANIYLALQDPRYAKDIQAFLRDQTITS